MTTFRDFHSELDETLCAELERMLGLLLFADRCLERGRAEGARESIADTIKRAQAALAALRGYALAGL